jgi:hypothetical protein
MTHDGTLTRAIGSMALCASVALACSANDPVGSPTGGSSQATQSASSSGSSTGSGVTSSVGAGGADVASSVVVGVGSTTASGSGDGVASTTGSSTVSTGAGGSSDTGAGGASVVSDAGNDTGATVEGGVAGDQPPWRPIKVTVARGLYKHSFRPHDADAMAVQQNNAQSSGLDTTRPVLTGKLLVDIGFNRGELLDYFLHGGFHVLALDFAGVDEVPDVVAAGAESPDNYGKIRLEALDGVDRTPLININYHDSLEGHLVEGLKYLHAQFPGEDWGYYLNQDGSVRYSDVIITGLSHGASSAALFGVVRRVWRAVSSSGPRDNSCGTDPACKTGVVATWLSDKPKTPIDRFYGMTGSGDVQYPEILYAMEKMGYIGKPVNVLQVAAPYNGSHRLTNNGPHARYCNEAQYAAACNYMFGVPAQNQ